MKKKQSKINSNSLVMSIILIGMLTFHGWLTLATIS
ncbi:hypothetical protein SAMN05421755_101521 [Nitrosomonas sp. Nm33]|nr:hypothetical protein SAMN05421755_101521 [Nitrosomonas sp. Nm33]